MCDFINIYEENILQTITYIITICDRARAIHISCNSTSENVIYWDFLAFADIYYFGNYQQENTDNQQQISIQVACS